jgi:hypothetical protein
MGSQPAEEARPGATTNEGRLPSRETSGAPNSEQLLPGSASHHPGGEQAKAHGPSVLFWSDPRRRTPMKKRDPFRLQIASFRAKQTRRLHGKQ